MNISRLSTFSLTLAVAVMMLGYSTPAFAGKKCELQPEHPSCKGGGGSTETAAKYEAALTVGGFIFGPLPVTLNKRKNAYHGQTMVDMVRPESVDMACVENECMAWDNVFGTCDLLTNDSMSPVLIPAVTAGDNWTINISGRKLNGSVSNNPESDILIRFRDVVADNFLLVDIDFNLIGKIGLDTGGFEVNKFLPESGDTSSFTLDTFNFFASGSQGGGCSSGIVDLYTPSTLTIKRTE